MKKLDVILRIGIFSLLLFLLCSKELTVHAEEIDVPLEVQFCQTEARKEFEMLNSFRTGNEAWYWNEDNTSKTYLTNQYELEYDYALEEVAMQRAVEIALYYSHTRPDGNSCWQTYTDKGYVIKNSAGENIAYGYTSAKSVFEAFKEDDEYYSGQGHRRNMLSDKVVSCGFGCVYYQGFYFWAQEFSGYNSGASQTAANNSTSICYARVHSIDGNAFSMKDYTLTVGDTVDLNTIPINVNYQVNGDIESNEIAVSPAFSVEDTSVASISGNTLTVIKGGSSTVINAKFKIKGVEYTAKGNLITKDIVNTSSTYRVEHYKEDLNGQYTIEPEIEVFPGTIGEIVTPSVKRYEGFNSPSPQKILIKEDGSAVLKYYYSRASYKLTWNFDGGTVTGSYSSGYIKYGSTISTPNVSKTNYNFLGWGASVPSTMPANALTFTAEWESIPITEVEYTVKHYQRTADLQGWELADTDILKGTVGENITPKGKDYTGFRTPDLQTITLSSYGSNLVEYYYHRKFHNITWDANGGNIVTGISYNSSAAYGGTFIAPSVKRYGYTFEGWEPELPETMPDEDMTFKAIWKIEPIEYVDYIVEHYKQDLNGKYTIQPETQSLSGKLGTKVTPSVETYTGFTSPSTETITLSSDGNNVVKYYYKRNSYSLVWNLNGGTASGDFTSGDVKFEEKITAPVVSKPGYVFKNWNVTVPSTMPARAVTITANWEISTDTPYKVEHYKQDLDGNYNTAPIVDNCTGTTGMYAVPDKREFDGYVYSFGETDKIEADGSTVVKYYYERATYYLIWDLDGGTAGGDYTEWEVKYGAPITAPTVSKEGYTFAGWDAEVPSNMPAKHLTITAQWVENTNNDVEIAICRVEHYKENLDGSYTIVSYDTRNLECLVGSSITPAVKDYTGFNSPTSEKVVIKAEGNTVIYYYTRKTYNLTWDFNGGSASGNYSKGSIKYGAQITVPSVSRANYTFDGWDVEIPTTMPAENLTIKAQWVEKSINESEVAYRVEHYKENLDGTYSIVSSDTQDKTGKANSSVTPTVKSYTGFDSPTAQEVVINADGSTVVEYKYKRKLYKLTWNFNGGSASGNYSSGDIKYGTKITVPTVSKTNYIFDGWNVEIPTTMPAQDLTIKANWADQIVSYTVKHFKENLDGSYSVVNSDTLIKTASAGSKVTPAVNNYTGFKAPSERQFTVRSDGSTVAEYYYKRKTYKLTWDLNGGSASGDFTEGEVKYGTAIIAPAVTKENCAFDSWDIEIPETMPAKDLTISVLWKGDPAYSNIPYKVEHYKENLDGSYSLVSSDTQNESGKAGSSITPAVKSYTGFDSPSMVSTTINADGSTVVKYKYKRKSYKLIWDLNGGSASGNYTYGDVKFGTKITVPTVSKTDCVFDGWDVEIPTTMPAKDLTIKATWKDKIVSYKVEHYKEKLDGSGYELADTENLKGTIGLNVSPDVKTYEGFSSPDKKTDIVKSDGKTVIKYEYKRNTYKLTWDLAGGSASGKYTSGKVKYGSKIIAPEPQKDGYSFNKWITKVPTTMPAKDLTIKASWTENPNIEHNPELTAEDQVKAFVRRFYTIILEREKVNEEEIEYYTSRLLSHEIDGCTVARGFVMSPEYIGKGEDNLTFVNKMYAAFFNREADDAQFYINLLESGQTREVVLAGFVNSPEFKNLCAEYGINPGELVVESQNNNSENNQGNQGNNPSDDVTKLNLDTTNVDPDKLDEYVRNLYLKILGREYDEGGLKYWKEQIMAGTTYDAATAARVGFFESEEYKNKNKTSEQFVTDCYHAFLGREPEADGLSYWMNKLDSGEYSKQKVIDLGFGHSDEFKGILSNCGFRIIE